MLHFFINRGAELNTRPPFSPPLTIKSCIDDQHAAVPLSRIYVTTPHYAGLLKQTLGEQFDCLQQLPEQHSSKLLSLPDFPKSFRNLGFESVQELHTEVKQQSRNPYQPKFALVNGIGTGLGDNYVGIGVLQRLIKLLAPLRPKFCLLQELQERIEPIYTTMSAVEVSVCFMPLSDFLKFDYYIDFSSVENMPSFNDVAAAHFNAYAFSINKLLPNSNIQAKINIDKTKTIALKKIIQQSLPANRKTVLLHPLASSGLRKLPSAKAAELTRELGDAGYNVVSAFEHNSPPAHFLSLAEHSNNITDLIHIVDAVDAVLSVGTVTYHLASALGKPTLLLPTVQADIRSAELMPEVLAWLPKENKDLYPNLHKSEKIEDIQIAEKIWSNVNSKEVVTALGHHIHSLSNASEIKHTKHKVSPRVAVIVPYAPQTKTLASCMGSLVKVQGFDPQDLFTIESDGLGHSHHRYTDAFNDGIQQALANDYEFIWLIHENAQVPKDFLQKLLKHFSYSNSVGIVSGSDRGAECLYGNTKLLPDPLISRTGSESGLSQPWISFASCLIRAEVFNEVTELDNTMQRLFGDVDFCVRAAEHGWQTWFDPTVEVVFEAKKTAQKTPNTLLQNTLMKSAEKFYLKWGPKLNETKTERIEEALIRLTGF